jgi:maleate cis-trans isomerase
MLEQDLGATVLSNVPTDVWATLKHLRIHEPIQDMGTLLRELP